MSEKSPEERLGWAIADLIAAALPPKKDGRMLYFRLGQMYEAFHVVEQQNRQQEGDKKE